jgi:hypothetical protein
VTTRKKLNRKRQLAIPCRSRQFLLASRASEWALTVLGTDLLRGYAARREVVYALIWHSRRVSNCLTQFCCYRHSAQTQLPCGPLCQLVRRCLELHCLCGSSSSTSRPSRTCPLSAMWGFDVLYCSRENNAMMHYSLSREQRRDASPRTKLFGVIPVHARARSLLPAVAGRVAVPCPPCPKR